MTEQDSRPTVLIVDDNEKLTDMYEMWLKDEYPVKTAYSGREALEEVDETVDIIFLDRRLGDIFGGEVLDEIKDRGLDCRVVMLTRLKPDIEIIQREIDAYLEKPVDRDVLYDTITTIQDRSNYNDTVREWISVQNKIEVLRNEMNSQRQKDSAFLSELKRYAGELEEEMNRTSDELSHLLVRPEDIEVDVSRNDRPSPP